MNRFKESVNYEGMKVLYLTSQSHKSLTPSYPNYHRVMTNSLFEHETESKIVSKKLKRNNRILTNHLLVVSGA